MNVNKKIKIDYIVLLVMVILIFIMQIFLTQNIIVIIGMILVVYSLLSSEKNVLYLMMILIPNSENMKMIGTMSIPMVIVIACFFKSVLKIVLSKKIKLKEWIIVFIVLLLYSLATISILGNNEQLILTVKFLMYLSFVESAFEDYKRREVKLKDIYSNQIRALSIGLIISTICTILTNRSVNAFGRFSFGENSTINTIGIQCAIVVIGLIYNYIIKNSKKVDAVLIIFNILIIIFTMSRTAMIMIALGIILFIILTLIKKENVRMIVFTTLIGLILGTACFVSPTVKQYSKKIINRFQADDISNGRYILWEKTVEQMSNSNKRIMFGVGDYKIIGATYNKSETILVAHNFILEIWVIYGIIGIFILSALIIHFVKDVFYEYTKHNIFITGNLYNFVPMLVFFAGSFYSHHFIGKPSFILFILSLIPAFLKNDKEKEKIIILGEKSEKKDYGL